MVLESTMLCVDDSEYMRNGDFIPSRLQAEQDAVSLICTCKLRVHPENNVGLMTMSQPVEVLSTLTTDTSKIFMKMHKVQPRGNPNFIAALRVAHLALKHRQGRNHKTRIVIFVGSPIALDKNELVKVAKRLKKEKVYVDVINFSQEEDNMELLKSFIETLNGKDGTSSHLVTVPAGSAMSEALLSSPILRSEDGTAPAGVGGMGGGMDFMVDANEDPELALALRVSMEEQRARQEDEMRRTQEASGGAAAGAPSGEENKASAKAELLPPIAEGSSASASANPPNFDAMTEEEQIAWALQMSLGSTGEEDAKAGEGPAAKKAKAKEGEKMEVEPSVSSEDVGEFADLLSDPAALEDLVKTLPGVNVDSKAVRESIEKLKKDGKKPDGKTANDADKKPADGKSSDDKKKPADGKQ